MSSIDDGYAAYRAMQEELGEQEQDNDPKLPRTGRFELHVPGKVRVPVIEERIRAITPVFEVATREIMREDGDLGWKTVYTWDAVDPAYDGPFASSLRLEACQIMKADVYLVWFAITGMAAVWEG